MSIIKVKGTKNGKQKYIARVRYTNLFGVKKTIEKTVYGKEEAKLKEIELTKLVNNRQFTGNYTIRQFYEEFREAYRHQVRESTYENFKKSMRNRILPVLGNIKLKDLTLQVLNKWKIEISKKNLSLASKHNTYAKLRHLLNFAVQIVYIPNNPLLKAGNFKGTLEIKKEIEVYIIEEFLECIKVAKAYAENAEKKGYMSKWDYYAFFNIAFIPTCEKARFTLSNGQILKMI